MTEYGYSDHRWVYQPDSLEQLTAALDMAAMSAEAYAREVGFDVAGVEFKTIGPDPKYGLYRIGWYIDTEADS